MTIPQVQALIEENELTNALEMLDVLHKQNPKNVQVLELLGMTLLECDETSEETIKKAMEYLMQAVSLSPDSGYDKYLYLAQLSCGYEAVQYLTKALELLSLEYQRLTATNSVQELKLIVKKSCSALCSTIEIFMTDCCDDPVAEQKCEEYISQALQLDQSNPEVLQTLASIRLSQCRTIDAQEAITAAVNTWINQQPTSPLFPPYENRINQAKLLMETENHELALTVLKTALLENDQDIQVWYLFGWCYYILGGGPDDTTPIPNMKEESLNYFEDARECFIKALKVTYTSFTYIQLFQNMGQGEIDVITHSEQLLVYVNECLKLNNRDTVEISVFDEMDDGEEWEDFDE
jgi:tetratricopeptide (TPR) repeat protein